MEGVYFLWSVLNANWNRILDNWITMPLKDEDKRLASYVSSVFVDNQNVFLRFRGVPRKIISFISWFRLKIIVVGRYTTRPDCRFADSFAYILNLPKIWIKITRSSRQEVLCKKVVFRNFAKLTGKHLFQSLFFNKLH